MRKFIKIYLESIRMFNSGLAIEPVKKLVELFGKY